MRLKQWIFLFFTTLLIGGLAALFIGFYLERNDVVYGGIGWGKELLISIIGKLGAGMMFSVLSQMGFFAYLTIHYFAIGVFKNKWIWQGIQLVLIGFAVYDTAYLRHYFFGKPEESLSGYFDLPIILLVVALVIAIIKVRLTKREAFIPTVFFLVVATLIEAIPSLHENRAESTAFMLIPLMACNIWQILQLHRLVNRKS